MSRRVLLVTGGRDYRPTEGDAWWLRGIMDALKIQCVRHGTARGVDCWAGLVAKRTGRAEDGVPADWAKHGKRAGFIRNERMLMPDVVAVVAFPGGRGTKHMRDTALKQSFDVIDHPVRCDRPSGEPDGVPS